MIAFFVDLRVTIDSVDREMLVEAMRRKGIREGIVVRCEDILRKMRNKVGRRKLGPGVLDGYLRRKGLTLNASKSKIMRFRKGGGRVRKVSWWWEGKVIEEIKEFKYLGYVFQRNGRQEAQVRDRIKKRAVIMGQVWGIGKRR